jgi:EmrB/QacA subfamily drug resistance transporter
LENSQKNEKRWLILGVMCIVLFIISIDNTVLNLALPSIALGFNAAASQLQWVVDAYTLVFASLLITTGAMGDRFGRKRLLIAGLALFGVGSLGAALSISINMLIGFRALLGLAGAMIMPSTLSILTNVFRDGRERAKAIAIWSSIFSIGAGIGPIIGGALINSFSWASVFYLNVPIVAIGIIGGIVLVPESFDARAPKPDLPGILFSAIGVVMLVYGMIRAGEDGWTAAAVLSAFGVSAVFLAAFIWWENHSANPMLPLEFFKNMSFTGANVALTFSAFGMMGGMYFFSQFLQSVQGYSPLTSALCMFPMTPAVFMATMISVRVNRNIGTKLTMCLGLLLSGLGIFVFSQVAQINASYWYILLVQILLGSGIGFTMSPATSSIMNSLPPSRAGIGSAMNDTTRQLGGALGIAVLGALMNGVYRREVNQLAGTNGLSESMLANIRGSVQGAHAIAQGLDAKLASLVMQTSSQAFIDGMRQAFLVSSAAFVIAALMAWLILPNKAKVVELKKAVLVEE